MIFKNYSKFLFCMAFSFQTTMKGHLRKRYEKISFVLQIKYWLRKSTYGKKKHLPFSCAYIFQRNYAKYLEFGNVLLKFYLGLWIYHFRNINNDLSNSRRCIVLGLLIHFHDYLIMSWCITYQKWCRKLDADLIILESNYIVIGISNYRYIK